MGKAKSRHRIEAGLADMSLADAAVAERTGWWPDPEECDESRYTLDVTATGRLLIRYLAFGARIVEFALIQQEHDGRHWRDVLRVDTHHGEVHVHYFDDVGDQVDRRVMRTITALQDVEDGYAEAEELVYGGWEDNVRRWQSGF